jgi:hypothetical protein
MFNKKQLEKIEKILSNLEKRMAITEGAIIELIESSTKEIKSLNALWEEINKIFQVLNKAIELQEAMEIHNTPKNQMN